MCMIGLDNDNRNFSVPALQRARKKCDSWYGSKSNFEVETNQDGRYEFDLTPEESGGWSAKAQWITDKGYYISADSQEVQFEVISLVNDADSLPFDTTYLIVIAVLVVVLVSALVYVKYRRS